MSVAITGDVARMQLVVTGGKNPDDGLRVAGPAGTDDRVIQSCIHYYPVKHRAITRKQR